MVKRQRFADVSAECVCPIMRMGMLVRTHTCMHDDETRVQIDSRIGASSPTDLRAVVWYTLSNLVWIIAVCHILSVTTMFEYGIAIARLMMSFWSLG